MYPLSCNINPKLLSIHYCKPFEDVVPPQPDLCILTAYVASVNACFYKALVCIMIHVIYGCGWGSVGYNLYAVFLTGCE